MKLAIPRLVFGTDRPTAIGAIIYFGIYQFGRGRTGFAFTHPFLDHVFHLWEKSGIRPNLPKYLADPFSDFLERRNEFWTTYGQVIIAALVIVVLTLLLPTRTISAEAGSSILSDISGFAVAKGVPEWFILIRSGRPWIT
jgi:hypothetical protein